jgi:hypothetical protein
MVPNLFAAFAGFDEHNPIVMAVRPTQSGMIFMELIAENPDCAHERAYALIGTRKGFSANKGKYNVKICKVSILPHVRR